MDFTFWDNITHYKTRSVHFWGLLNSATEAEEGVLVFQLSARRFLGALVRGAKMMEARALGLGGLRFKV